MQKNRLGNFPTRFIIEPKKSGVQRISFFTFIIHHLQRIGWFLKKKKRAGCSAHYPKKVHGQQPYLYPLIL